MRIEVEGKLYWVHGEHVEVYVAGGEPKVMREARPACWRGLNPEGPVAKKVKAAYAAALKKEG